MNIINELKNDFNQLKLVYKDFTLEELYTLENLLLFADATASGFYHRSDTIYFMKSKDYNCVKLRNSILNNTFKPSYYKTKVINERGKLRTITPPTFETKLVQKIISELILRPMLEPKMIETSYATIRGRGTDIMFNDIINDLNENLENYKFIVKLDCKNYFGSINKNILKETLFEDIKDERIVDLLMSFYKDEIGLSLGNEVSQLPASAFLTPVDKYITSKYDCKYYRYMDDILIICKNKKDVKSIINDVERETNKLNITINKNKTEIIGIKGYFVFCKERFFYSKENNCYYNMINPKRISTQVRKIKYLSKENPEKLKSQYKSVKNSFIKHGNCYNIINYLDKVFEEEI